MQTLRKEIQRTELKRRAKAVAPLLPVLLFGLTAFTPDALAQTEVWTRTSTSFVAELNAILRPLSVAAIILMGILGFFGKMEWGRIGVGFIAIIIANGAATIVDFLQTQGGGSAS